MSKWSKTLILLGVMSMLGACEDSITIKETRESADEFSYAIKEFTQRVDELQLEDKVTEVEGEVVEGLSTVTEEMFKMLEASTKEVKPTAGSGANLVKAEVINIVDGDTFDVNIVDTTSGKELGKTERVRLILIDTNESKGEYANNPQPYALEATAFTKSVLEKQTVWLEVGVQERDPYGRLLAYGWLDSISYEYLGEKRTFKNITINELLLLEGLARVAIYPPNTQYLDEFEEIEKGAKKNDKGIWTLE